MSKEHGREVNISMSRLGRWSDTIVAMTQFSIIVSFPPGQVTLGHIKYSWVVFIICWLFQKVRHSSSRALSQAYSTDLTRCHWQKLFWFWGAMLNQMDDANVSKYVFKIFIYALTIIISALAGFWTGLLLHRVKERRLWGDLSSRETGSSIRIHHLPLLFHHQLHRHQVQVNVKRPALPHPGPHTKDGL